MDYGLFLLGNLISVGLSLVYHWLIIGCVELQSLTGTVTTHILRMKTNWINQAVLEKISEKAKTIKGLDGHRAITQVILLIDEIESAKAIGISNAMICATINKSGGKIKESYFTEALHYARKKAKKAGVATLPAQTKPQERKATHGTASTPKPSLSPKQAREEKAKEYTSPVSSNPIFKKLVNPNKE